MTTIMSDNHPSEMAVIVLVPDCYATIRQTMRRLRAQAIAEQLEIVVVVPSAADLIVRLRRAVHDLRRSGQLRHLMPQVLPMLMVGLVCDAAGEMAGYLFGGGQAMRTLTEMEFHRHRFMKRRDQIAMDHHLREPMQLPISGAGS